MTCDSTPATSSTPRVLVVEDEAAMSNAVSLVLRRNGFEVECAPGAAEAITLFGTKKWDVVVTDLMMPGMKGDALAAILRGLDPAVPIVLMSGSSKSRELTFAFDYVVAKPFPPATLLNAIRQAVGAVPRE